jgi:hypothetical protein
VSQTRGHRVVQVGGHLASLPATDCDSRS